MEKRLYICALAIFVPLSADGQSASVAVGARVRVTSPTDNLKAAIGTVAEVRDDSLVVVNNHGRSRAIALANVTRLDVSTGRRSRFWRDAGLGLGIGGLAGAAFGFATYEECDDVGFMSCFLAPDDREEAAMWGGMVGSVIGLGTGALVGIFHRVDQWQPADLPAKVAVRPASGGRITVGLSRAF